MSAQLSVIVFVVVIAVVVVAIRYRMYEETTTPVRADSGGGVLLTQLRLVLTVVSRLNSTNN